MTQHDTQLASQARQNTRGEVPFDFRECFYSRTDQRGVILSGNDVFRRISGFEWSELLKAPHKLVRHPDMPRGAFHLKWERLKAGHPTAVYVKNRAKDGRYYWVLAAVWPVDDGYLSIRIKPSTPLFEKVRDIYAEVLAEEADGLSPEDGHASIVAHIRALGYSDYDAFQADALTQECAARAARLGEPQDAAQRRFGLMQAAIDDIRTETEQMTESFKAIRTVPMNMRILASRLENAGGPISAISVNYGSMLDEMANWVRDFVDGDDSAFVRIRGSIVNGAFLTCLASVQSMMATSFAQSRHQDMGGVDVDTEQRILTQEAEKYKANAAQALKVVETGAGRLSRSVLDMKRYVTGLSSTRMMCKIESASLSGSGDSLAGIVEQLDACQDEIESRLSKIVERNTVIQSNTSMLRALT
ncbi:PAS domain-containing protein [Aestuariicoccus sp. MJ-SS9]|uniref:PAS domain-containing protein n=1 Tax=Aestuariicoccus sp. MJ-SS9 TaxID=3079855 RepID=UPI00290CD8BF|nr:PAS domain-containing protein [Aestuariicoccus sp. MJ-SS9]MDU8911698.1 PAS domain-containing protein [Aestuariicoccus sp. MJ-SS9]